ncbi:MAG: hypothetical protein ACRD3Y_08685, partial [Bryobacteraceae bacterium]
MTDPLLSDETSPQKRRSTRIVQAVPIIVTGVDALGQPFNERTTTVMVNCHGCKYQSKHYVPKNSTVALEIPRGQQGLPPRAIQGRVVWVQRPRTVRELFQIGLEFEVTGNIWGIAFPPEDWFPFPDEAQSTESQQELEVPLAEPPAAITVSAESRADASTAPPRPTSTASESRGEPPVAAADSRIHVVPNPSQSAESQQAAAKQAAQIIAEATNSLDKSVRKTAHAAINEEMAVVRQQLDAQLHEAVEHAIKVSMERVSESAVKRVVQQAAERTSALVDQARKAGEISSESLDAKVRQAVQQAVTNAAEQASQKAAQQAAALNLKQTVDAAVERIIAEREASSPSLQILSSPEAAQQQLDQWKKNLEDTAQNVRQQTSEQLQTDSTAAAQRLHETFEAAASSASEKLGQRLDEVAQSAAAKAEQGITERSSGLHQS